VLQVKHFTTLLNFISMLEKYGLVKCLVSKSAFRTEEIMEGINLADIKGNVDHSP
jgi:hypothetical protein